MLYGRATACLPLPGTMIQSSESPLRLWPRRQGHLCQSTSDVLGRTPACSASNGRFWTHSHHVLRLSLSEAPCALEDQSSWWPRAPSSCPLIASLLLTFPHPSTHPDKDTGDGHKDLLWPPLSAAKSHVHRALRVLLLIRSTFLLTLVLPHPPP